MLPRSVMIVEDESVTARYISGIVQKLGIHVANTCDNGRDVLEALKKDTPECLLMDVNIRGSMDGFALNELIQHDYAIPVIFITGYCDNETLSRAYGVNAYGYVVKPFTEQDLETVLSSAWRRYRKEETAPEHKNNEEHTLFISKVHRYELDSRRLFCDEKEVCLTMKQNQLLEMLVRHRNSVVSYRELEYALWPEEEVSSSALRTLIYGLRKLAPQLQIKTQSKSGYTLIV